MRWAGGKNWLVRRLDSLIGSVPFNKYHEPFLGGASAFFSICGKQHAFLSDCNGPLIEMYQCVSVDVEKVISIMGHLTNSEAEYYRIRAARPECPFERAAFFIFLNQTSFNGIYRVNLKGQYNVPFGHRTKQFLDAALLRAAAHRLSSVTLKSCDFMDTLVDVKKGDLVFIDPPYTVSHNHNGFIKYNQNLFSLEDQYRLAEYVNAVDEIGAYYLLTNAAHDRIREIFHSCGDPVELSRASLIGGKQAKRGAVSEFMFTNLEVLQCVS